MPHPTILDTWTVKWQFAICELHCSWANAFALASVSAMSIWAGSPLVYARIFVHWSMQLIAATATAAAAAALSPTSVFCHTHLPPPPPLLEPAPSPPLRFNCLFIAARRPFDSVDPAPLLAHQCVCGCVCVICGCCSLLMHYMNFNKLCILTDYPPPFRVCLL